MFLTFFQNFDNKSCCLNTLEIICFTRAIFENYGIKGVGFLKKLWCCVGGVVQDNLVLSTDRKDIQKLTFRALAVHGSESRNCGLWVVLIQKDGATLLVGTWYRGKKNRLVE